MKTVRVSVLGVPAHILLNDVPGTLLPVASLCDLLALLTSDRSWSQTAFRLLQLGNASAVLAGTFGILDFLRLPAAAEARRLGKRHAALNALVLPLFLLCQRQRRDHTDQPSRLAMVLLLAANVGLNVSAWHGARLVHQHGIRAVEQATSAPLAAQAEPVTW